MLRSLLITSVINWVFSYGGSGGGLQVFCEVKHVEEVCDLVVTIITTSLHHPCNL